MGGEKAETCLSLIEKLAGRLRPYLPYTALNTVWRLLDKGESILDVGCGKGEPMKFINRARNFRTVGLDVFKPYLIKAKKNNTHDDYILCDVRFMPIRDKSFDVVLCIEVLEHLNMEEGINLIRAMEKVARRQVILTTPVSEYEQHAYDNNPYLEHRYIWSVNEVKRLGYNIKGAGLKGIPGESGLVHKIPSFLKPILHVLWIIAGISTYNKPEHAGHMVCIKSARKNLS